MITLIFKKYQNKFRLWFVKWFYKYKFNRLYQELNNINSGKTDLYRLQNAYLIFKHSPKYIKGIKRLFKHYTEKQDEYNKNIHLNHKQRKVYKYLLSLNKSSSSELNYLYYQNSVQNNLPKHVPEYNKLTSEDKVIILAKISQDIKEPN